MSLFTQEYLNFFKDLAGNNHKEWFDENRKTYEQKVRKPFVTFTQEVIDTLAQHDERLKAIAPKHCMFRINRDIRFSPDKTPYKLNMSAAVSPGGKKEMTKPGIFFQFSPENVQIYSGVYQCTTPQLKALRYYIAEHIDEFETLIKAKPFVKLFSGEVLGSKNKVIPKDLKELGEKQPLLFNKQFYYGATLPPETILNNNLIGTIEAHYLAAKPLSIFFEKALNHSV